MTDPDKPLLQKLRVIFQRAARGPLLIGLGVIAVVAVIAVLSGSDDSESSPPGSEASPPEATTTEAPTANTTSTEEDDSEFVTIEAVDSSWIEGQGSLYTLAGYLGVIERAEDVGSSYQAARDAIAAEQERLTEQQRDAAKEAAQRRALAAYRAALRAAERERERQQRLLAERRQRIKEKLQRLREKYKVEPGEECTIPEVQAAFDCSTGYPF